MILKVRSKVKNLRETRQREKILSSAEQLFRQVGYVSATLEDVAKKAKINKTTIYRYYNNKAEILYANAIRNLNELLALSQPVCDSDIDPSTKLNKLISIHTNWRINKLGLAASDQAERRHLRRKLLNSVLALRDEYEGLYRKVIEEILRQNRVTYINSKVSAMFVLCLMNSLSQWYRPTGPVSADALSAIINQFVAEALKPS